MRLHDAAGPGDFTTDVATEKRHDPCEGPLDLVGLLFLGAAHRTAAARTIDVQGEQKLPVSHALEQFVASTGVYSYGGYPDIDGLMQEQAADPDPKRREATLKRIQQMVVERTMYAPIWELAFLNGVGPRVRESGLGLIAGHAYSAPYEDLALKGK